MFDGTENPNQHVAHFISRHELVINGPWATKNALLCSSVCIHIREQASLDVRVSQETPSSAGRQWSINSSDSSGTTKEELVPQNWSNEVDGEWEWQRLHYKMDGTHLLMQTKSSRSVSWYTCALTTSGTISQLRLLHKPLKVFMTIAERPMTWRSKLIMQKEC